MSAYSFFWKVWLRLNLLTKDVDNDYIAEVSTVKNTLRNEDLARRIVEKGSEITYETMLSSIKKYDLVVREAIQQGYSVMTENCQFTPRVSGSWITAADQFDPARHKITLDTVITNVMREALSKVGVEVLGVKESSGGITRLTDGFTGKMDGTITIGDTIDIEGDKIKIAGDEAEVGVFFVDASGVVTQATGRLRRNDPKFVQIQVPATLTEGAAYTLRIVTQYTSGNNLLKEPRTIEYDRPLTATPADSGSGGGGEDDRPVID